MHHFKKNMGVEVWLHAFLTSVLDGASGQLHFTGKDTRRALDGRLRGLTLPRIGSGGPALSLVSMLTELTRARNEFPA
jgi:hypothetical protein